MKEVEAARKDGRWDAAYASSANAKIPEDFVQEIINNKKAKAHFEILNNTNKYVIAYRLQTAKKPETVKKRKETIMTMLEEGKKFY